MKHFLVTECIFLGQYIVKAQDKQDAIQAVADKKQLIVAEEINEQQRQEMIKAGVEEI